MRDWRARRIARGLKNADYRVDDTKSWEAWLKRFIRIHRSKDAQKGRTLTITLQEALDLLAKQDYKCALTGIQLTRATNHPRAASMDRIDPALGHEVGNVQFICAQLNFCKHTLTNSQFIAWCKLVTRYTQAGHT